MHGKKRFIYLGLLGAAAGAFLIDRALRGGPEPAAAEDVAGPGVRRRQPARESGTKDRPIAADPALAWLDRLVEVEPDRNVFAPSLAMLKHYRMIEEADEPDNGGPAPGSPEAFALQHELQGTFVSRDMMIAVVDGKVLRLGDMLDDFRLTRIEPYRAEFRRGRDRLWLSIPMPTAAQ